MNRIDRERVACSGIGIASCDYRRKVRAGVVPTDELVDALLSEEADRVR